MEEPYNHFKFNLYINMDDAIYCIYDHEYRVYCSVCDKLFIKKNQLLNQISNNL